MSNIAELLGVQEDHRECEEAVEGDDTVVAGHSVVVSQSGVVSNELRDDICQDGDVGQPAKRRRGPSQDWELLYSTRDAENYKAWIEAEKVREGLIKGPRQKTELGEKQYWKCRYSRKRGFKQCKYQLYTLFAAGDTIFEIFYNNVPHEHVRTEEQAPAPLAERMDEPVRQVVLAGVADGLTQMQIRSKIRREKLPVPNKKQLENCIAHIRRSQGVSAVGFTTSDLWRWAENHSCGEQGLDEGYVAGHFLSVPDAPDGEPRFGVVLTTKRLMQSLSDANKAQTGCLHVDATYKLVWQGYPILVLALSDANHKMFPCALGIMSNEDTEAFQFLFSTLQTETEKEGGQRFQPSLAVADGAAAITAALRDVFGPGCRRAMCWAHVIRQVDKKILSIPDAEAQASVREAVRVLQLASSPTEFQAARALFADWLLGNPLTAEFKDYFWGQWMQKDLSGWFEGFTQAGPSTNNGLECINRTLKDAYPWTSWQIGVF